jgi:hypothetical protein
MAVFERTTSLDDAAKGRIRHRIWAATQSDDRDFLESSDIAPYILVAGVLIGLLTGPTLAVYWLPGARGWPWLIAAVVSLLVWLGVLLCVSDNGLGRFARRSPQTLFVATAAVCVLLIRTLPAEPAGASQWLIEGTRAGLAGAVVFLASVALFELTEPLWERLESQGRLQVRPQEAIIKELLFLLDDVERLASLHRQRDDYIRHTIARNRRKADLLDQGTTDYASSSREATILHQQAGGFVESYTLERARKDGSWEILMTEERAAPGPDPLREDSPACTHVRKQALQRIDRIATRIEKGLPAALGGTARRVDPWLQQELRARAQTIRAWGHDLVLPMSTEPLNLTRRMGQVLECVAQGRWGEIPKSDAPKSRGLVQRALRFGGNLGIGVVPLIFLVGAHAMEFKVNDAVRDSLLTFAIPWILLQVVELVAPGGESYVPLVKSVREALRRDKA